MQFETQRLILRPWKPYEDARYAMDIYGDARVMAWIDKQGKDTSIRQVQGRLQRYLDNPDKNIIGSWAVEQKDIGRVIGHMVLMTLPDLKNTRPEQNSWANLKCSHAQQLENESLEFYLDGLPTNYIEMGWCFRPASWGFGYATEAAFCTARYAFDQLQLRLLLAVTDPDNKRSINLAERLGMRCYGLTTRYYGGKPLLLYKLSPEELAAD